MVRRLAGAEHLHALTEALQRFDESTAQAALDAAFLELSVEGAITQVLMPCLAAIGTGWANGTGNNLNNIIIGNDGNNILNGKGGNNILTGGKGTDTFVLEKGTGHTIITDFEGAGRTGGDLLMLKGFGANASISHQGNSIFAIQAADHSVTHVTLQGVTSLVSSDYVFN